MWFILGQLALTGILVWVCRTLWLQEQQHCQQASPIEDQRTDKQQPADRLTSVAGQDQTPTAKQATSHEDDTDTEKLTDAVDRYAVRNLVFTGVIALAAVAQFVATLLQWNVMNAQNDIMNRQTGQTERTLELMQSEQRGWIGPLEPTIDPLEPNMPVKCIAQYKNFGATPAWICSTGFIVNLLEQHQSMIALPNTFASANGGNARENVVAPDQSIITFLAKAPVVSEDTVNRIKSGEVKLVLRGRIRYKVLGSEELRITDFCFTYDPERNRMLANDQYNYME